MHATFMSRRGQLLASAGLLLCLMMNAGVVHAQQLGRPTTNLFLTLEQAKDLALRNNKELNLARTNILEKHYAAAAAKTYYLPRIIGSLTYLRFDDELGSVLTTPGIFLPAKTISVPLVNQNAPVGGVFVAQPITKLVTVHAGVQIALADQAIAAAQMEKGARDIASGVSQAYLALWGLQQIEHAVNLQLTAAKEIVAAKASATLRLQILEGEKGLLEVRGKIAELSAQLAELLDVPACTVFELVESVPMPLPFRCEDEAIQVALSNHPQLQEAEQTIVKAHNGVRAANNDLFPDVNVIGGAFAQGMTDIFQDEFSFIGVSATYSFEWGKKLHVKHQRRTQLDMAHQNLQITIDKVRSEVRKAFREYEQSLAALRLADETLQASKDAELEAQGLPAIAAAKAATAQAAVAQIQADLNYRIAHTKLVHTIGQP